MKHLSAILVCCVVVVVLAEEQPQLKYPSYPRFIERYCESPHKQELNKCGVENGQRAHEIYQHCMAVTTSAKLTTLEEMEKFLCVERNDEEFEFLKSCVYGSLWLDYKSGKNASAVAEMCLRRYET